MIRLRHATARTLDAMRGYGMHVAQVNGYALIDTEPINGQETAPVVLGRAERARLRAERKAATRARQVRFFEVKRRLCRGCGKKVTADDTAGGRLKRWHRLCVPSGN